MLQITANGVEENRTEISKLLLKNGKRAIIKGSTITIRGTISEELASQLYSYLDILAFNNYDDSQVYIP